MSHSSVILETLLLRLPLMVTALSCLYALTESETSYTWRLDAGVGKVMPDTAYFSSGGEKKAAAVLLTTVAATESDDSPELRTQEVMLDILMSTVTNPEGTWKKTAPNPASYCARCPRPNGGPARNNRGLPIGPDDHHLDSNQNESKDEVLDCGKPVNFTYYDHLVGIQNRATHPHIPEPDVAWTFGGGSKKMSSGSSTKKASEVDIDAIEKRLKRSKRDKPKSVELYNQIGNFWRIKGDTHKSIECFRRALAVSPNNADILLNLARVLFNLQYLDDAIFLTRRSLEVQPPDQNAWMQHFQLGEILKAYCHYQEAALHLRHVLELKPNYAPALSALQDMESMPDSSVHNYTIVIIVFLVLTVLAWVLSTLDISLEELAGITSTDTNGGANTMTNNGHQGRFNRMRLHSKR